MGRATKAGITKAHRLRAAHDLGLDGPVPDLLALAERDCGVPVVIPERIEGGDVAGAYLPRDGTPVIVLNGADSAPRLRFTLAHELGHHVFRDDRQSDTHAGIVSPGHWIEVRANAFAAELLMPGPGVEALVAGRNPTVALVAELVETFGTSPLASAIRLQTAGLASATQVERLRSALEASPPAVDYEDSITAAKRALPRWPNPRSPLARGLPSGLARSA